MKRISKCFFLAILVSSVLGVKSQPIINEILAANGKVNHDRSREFDDWVELYNPTDVAINVAGMYFTDQEKNLKKHKITGTQAHYTTIPPKGYRIFWFDGQPEQGANHVGFKLNAKGETLLLVNRDGKEVIDKVIFHEQRSNYSYGRLRQGDQWNYFKLPTPNKPNTEDGAIGFASKPVLSNTGGLVKNKFKLTIKAGKNEVVYYTLNGKSPIGSSKLKYTKPIVIDSTSIVRTVSNGKGCYHSVEVAANYFFNSTSTIPLLAITTDDEELFTSTDPKLNVFQEKPIHIQMYEPNGQQVFSTIAGMRLVGKAIRNYPQKSISIHFRGGQGVGYIDYQLFPDKPKQKYAAFALRNSGNDWRSTMMRDALMHRLVNGTTAIDCQGYQPVNVFINGNYFGIHNLREKLCGHYIQTNHGEKEIDMFEYGSAPIQGTYDNLNEMMKFFKKADMKRETAYDSALAIIDIDNFIDYQIAEIFYANTDWPMANMKYWRPRKKEGKWRWILFDTDLAFEKNKRRCKGHHNTLDYALGINNCHLDHLSRSLVESTIWLQKLIQNEKFKKRFIQRFMDHLNTTFSSERVIGVIADIKSKLEPEMPKHINKWGVASGVTSIKKWNSLVNQLITFAKERPDTVRKFLNQKFELGQRHKIELDVNDTAAGEIKINSLLLNQYPWSGKYFEGMNVEIMAVPKIGYKFLKWEGISRKESIIYINLKESVNAKAVFRKKAGN